MTILQNAATLCYALYDYADSPKVAWDYLDDGTNSDGVYWAAVRCGGLLWCVLRGSVTDKDWRRDFDALPDPFFHDDIGLIHPGFYAGLPTVRDKLLSLRRDGEPIGVTGHSLGAGRAAQLSGLLVVAGQTPAASVRFGEPRGCGDKLIEIGRAIPTSISIENIGPDDATNPLAHDLVTDVAPWFKHFGSMEPEIVTPRDPDDWGAFRYHHAYLYAHAVGLQHAWQY